MDPPGHSSRCVAPAARHLCSHQIAALRSLSYLRNTPCEPATCALPLAEVARPQQVDRSDLGIQSVGVSLDVTDEHGALGACLERRCPDRHHANAGRGCDRVHRIHRFQGHGPHLLRRRDLRGLRWVLSRSDANGGCKHDGCHAEIWAVTGRVHCAPSRLSVLCRHRQCRDHQAVSYDLVMRRHERKVLNQGVF